MSEAHELKEHLWKKLAQGPFMMVGLTDPQTHAEPLTAQLDDDQVDRIYFFIGAGNRVAPGGPAMAQFVSKGHDFFACLSGRIVPSNDRAMIDKLWSNAVEAWFPGGKDDPNLRLVYLDIDEAELWESDLSMSGKLKLLFGGRIRPGEAGNHAKVHSTAI